MEKGQEFLWHVQCPYRQNMNWTRCFFHFELALLSWNWPFKTTQRYNHFLCKTFTQVFTKMVWMYGYFFMDTYYLQGLWLLWSSFQSYNRQFNLSQLVNLQMRWIGGAGPNWGTFSANWIDTKHFKNKNKKPECWMLFPPQRGSIMEILHYVVRCLSIMIIIQKWGGVGWTYRPLLSLST